MQVAMLPWRYNAKMLAPQTRYTLRRNTASIMKSLVLVNKTMTFFSEIHWKVVEMCIANRFDLLLGFA